MDPNTLSLCVWVRKGIHWKTIKTSSCGDALEKREQLKIASSFLYCPRTKIYRVDKACSVRFDTCCHANRVNHAGEYLHHSVPKHSDIISTLCVSFKKDLPPDCAYEHLSLIFLGSVLRYLFTYLFTFFY